MRLTRTVPLALALTVVSSIGLAGCASNTGASTPDDIVFVLSPTTGGPGLAPSDLETSLAALDVEGDRLVAVVADGSPAVVVDVTVGELPENSDERSDTLAALRSKASTAILAKRAVAPEVDLAEAISLAAEAFRPNARHTLTIFGSGLQTIGALSMLEGRLYAEPADLVSNVEQTGGIPDLSTVEVSMPRIGVVTDPQPQLTEDARGALVSIWTEYFARAAAPNPMLQASALLPIPGHDVLPAVSAVPVDRPQPIAASGCSQVLGMSSIGFEAGSAEIVDVDALTTTLLDVVGRLAECPGAYIVGGSASSEGDVDANQTLSDNRARAVAAVLGTISGVPSTDITVIGWGEAWPCRIADTDQNGDLVLDAAIANRVVVVGRGETGC